MLKLYVKIIVLFLCVSSLEKALGTSELGACPTIVVLGSELETLSLNPETSNLRLVLNQDFCNALLTEKESTISAFTKILKKIAHLKALKRFAFCFQQATVQSNELQLLLNQLRLFSETMKKLDDIALDLSSLNLLDNDIEPLFKIIAGIKSKNFSLNLNNNHLKKEVFLKIMTSLCFNSSINDFDLYFSNNSVEDFDVLPLFKILEKLQKKSFVTLKNNRFSSSFFRSLSQEASRQDLNQFSY